MNAGTSFAGAVRSRQIDPAVLGYRIRAARHAAGLTQAQVAHPRTSTAYLSRIEAGQRRPSDRLLEWIATKVKVPVAGLLAETADEEHLELWLTLTQTERLLTQGQPQLAETASRALSVEAEALGLDDLASHARTLHGASALALGDTQKAIAILRTALDHGVAGSNAVRAHAALCSAYLQLGDPELAVQHGSLGAAIIEDCALHSLPDSLALAHAYARAQRATGDLNAAATTCATAIRSARRIHDTSDFGTAFWRASITESRRGIYADAWRHAERAAALESVYAYDDSLLALRHLAAELAASPSL